MFSAPLLCLWLSILFSTCIATVYFDPRNVSSTSYDFIVVGAGTAGSVIAARLTENPKVKVLVIEAGFSDIGQPDLSVLKVPFFAGQGVGTQFDWNYTTVNQAGLNNRSMAYPRGFVVGGSSALNNLVYLRGPSDDFNRLASVSGDLGWSWDLMFYYALKSERHVAAWDNTSTSGKINPLVHGFGPITTSITGNTSEIDLRVMQTTQQSPSKFPFNLDLNSGNGLGFGWMQSTVGNSVRSSGATAYLTPSLSRPNLDLLVQTQAIKVVQSSKTSAFTGVQVAQSASDTPITLFANKEVILSAGTVGTPQLLMLSGIGPAAQLQKFGIKTIVNVSDVGQNMQDQPIFFFQNTVTGAQTLSPLLNNETAFGGEIAQYAATKTGLLASDCLINTIGFLRLPSSSSILKQFGDPSAGSGSPHFQFSFLPIFINNPNQVAPTDGNWMSVSVVLQTPTSRGSVTLASASAFDHPLIDPAFLSTPFDIATSIQAVKSLNDFFSTPAWDGFIGGPALNGVDLTSDSAIEAFIRAATVTIKHPVGTARISKVTDRTGVVGPDLRVKNVSGLRIVDASILPFAVEGFPQAQLYMIAERAADLIKATYSI